MPYKQKERLDVIDQSAVKATLHSRLVVKNSPGAKSVPSRHTHRSGLHNPRQKPVRTVVVGELSNGRNKAQQAAKPPFFVAPRSVLGGCIGRLRHAALGL
jgi:hypothetical protein